MEDSREGEGDDEKGRWMQSPHVDDEKGKKAIVYKIKEEKRKEDGENDSKIIALGLVRGNPLLKLRL